MSYGVNYCAHYRRGAYVRRPDPEKGPNRKILPVELPDKFELVINLEAAESSWVHHPAEPCWRLPTI